MTDENEITPRLGRIGNAGSGSATSFARRVTRHAGQLSRPGSGAGFTGTRKGRGSGAVPQAKAGVRSIARSRLRRVVVKVHIARAKGGIGARAFGQHVHYVQRDGVERDGRGGELYGRAGEEIDARAYTERSAHDRHQFRLTVSAEDADQLGDFAACRTLAQISAWFGHGKFCFM